MPCPTSVTELEISLFDLRYAHTRVADGAAVRSLVESIERFGQLSPVVVVPEAAETGAVCRYVLLDGYRRVRALKRLRRDTAWAELWHAEELDALVYLFVRCRDRRFEPLEQAQLLRDLKARFALSTEELARRLARDPSWVSRRLALLDGLPDEALSALCAGSLSAWAAARVIAPVARANPEHARALIAALAREPLSTRDLALWWSYYPKATRAVRDEMVAHPTAFVRALRAQDQALADARLAEGPEGPFLRDLRSVAAGLRRLVSAAPDVLAAPDPRRQFLSTFPTVRRSVQRLDLAFQELSHDLSRNSTSDPRPAPEGNGATPHCQAPPDQPQDGPAGLVVLPADPHPTGRG
jgi:ParB/RepB/Spo0J family partition protein